MILLDDKERDILLEEFQDTYQDWSRDNLLAFFNKAQAKKIYEWGEEQCQGHHTSGIWFKRRECTKCWQDLRQKLKEID